MAKKTVGRTVRDALDDAMRSPYQGKPIGERSAWERAHFVAVEMPISGGIGRTVVDALRSLAIYADHYAVEFDSPLGEDHVIGDQWIDAVRAVHGLLDGPTGGLDCGTASTAARAMAAAAGFSAESVDRLEWVS